MKLHLGCGRNVLEGWVNLDTVALPGVDVVFDLETCARTPLPFADDSVDEVLANHVIEHIAHPLPLMQELHRVARAGATAVFAVPYGSSDDAYEDPTHVRRYFLNSFSYFSQPAYWRADYGFRGDWATRKVTLVVDGDRYTHKSPDEILAAVRAERNVVKEMVVEMVAVKPIREPRAELQDKFKIAIELD